MSALPQTEQKMAEAINDSMPDKHNVESTNQSSLTDTHASNNGQEALTPNQGQSPQSSSPEPMSIDEDEQMRKNLNHDELYILVKTISELPTDDVNAITRAADEVLPEDVALDSKHLRAAVHPDKFQNNEQKQMANSAFQRLDGALQHHHSGGDVKFYFGGKKLKQHVEKELSDYHHTAHNESTQYLRILCKALLENALGLSEGATARINLDKINESLKSQNKSNNVDEELGKIRYDSLLGKWRAAASSPQVSAIDDISLLCREFHYPPEWARIYDDCVQHAQVTSNPKNQPCQAGTTTYQNHSKITTGGKRVIALAPQKVQRAIKHGYTSTGEKILFIQELGENRARFVVEMPDATRRLVESATAGGRLALEGAREEGVPEVIRREADIFSIRAQVKQASTYGITFVAIGAWDMSKKRLPFVVVGFFYTIGAITKESAVSRSNLGKIIGLKEGERMIVEAMEVDREFSLREALELQISPPALGHHGEPQQPEITGRPRISWERQEAAWFQKPKPQFKPAHIPQQFEGFQQQAQPSYQPEPQKHSYQQGLQQTFQQGLQQSSYQPELQQPSYHQGFQQPFQQGLQQPSYQQGLQQPFQQELQQPSYQPELQQPSYHQGFQQPSYHQGFQQPFQQGLQQPFYQQGFQQPFQQGFYQPSYHQGFQQPFQQGFHQPIFA